MKNVIIILPEENGRLPTAAELVEVGFQLSESVADGSKGRKSAEKADGAPRTDESGKNMEDGGVSEAGQ